MFATPIPPTTSEIPAIAVVNRVRNVRNCDAWSMKSCWAVASKSRSVESVMRWRSSRIAVTCASAAGTAAAERAVDDHGVDLVATAQYVAAGRLQRHVGDVVLLVVGAATPITRNVVRPIRNPLPDRLAGVAAEQLGDRPRPEDHDLGLGALLLLVEERAGDQLEVGDVGVVRRRAGDPGAVAGPARGCSTALPVTSGVTEATSGARMRLASASTSASVSGCADRSPSAGVTGSVWSATRTAR